ncbi:sugar transporter ERD6-like 7 [Chenopodium quinoa]|uniref:sugar transporter ERD6-like 7 n=1 Tax=Chenopodium quinoa TaxID=63459 RepID=UPI000B78FE9C|nr:sugar transporter ERD6-like 7 [Chenopodium quinoa]
MSSSADVERGDSFTEARIQLQIQSAENNVGESTGHPWMVYFCTFIAACAGYSSPTQSAITEELQLSEAEFSLFGSILTFGAMFGAITSGFIADYLGRIMAMKLYALFCTGGWLAIYFSKSSLALHLGRLAGGYGMGAFSYVVPIYIAEISPVSLRGALTTLNQVMISTGISIAFLVGIPLSWRALALMGLIPFGIMLLGLLLTPESPRWLAREGRADKFKVSLQKLRGKKTDITLETAEIERCVEELKLLPKAKIYDLFRKKYLKSVIIGVGLMIFQQFGGINGICFYASNIFKMAGFSPKLGTIIYTFLQVVITCVGATLIDKLGRKPLQLVSAAGASVGFILVAVAFYLQAHGKSTETAGILAATGILVYVAFFSIGLGPVPWVIMSEIFPINIKGLAGSLATLVNWFCAWLVSYKFQFLMNWSTYGTFFIFAAINALGFLFVITIVPETKGKTLEQIQDAINN